MHDFGVRASGSPKLHGSFMVRKIKPTTSPAANDPLHHHDEHEPDEMEVLIAQTKKYAPPAIIAIAVILLAVFAFNWITKSSGEKSFESRQAVLSAASENPADPVGSLKTAAAKYPDAKELPIAMLSAGSQAFQLGQYDNAIEMFEGFTKDYPKHENIANAEYNLACAVEASGQADRALELFQAWSSKYNDHYLSVEAKLSEGRCLEQLNKFDEAATLYTDLLEANKGNEYESHIATFVARATREARRVARTVEK